MRIQTRLGLLMAFCFLFLVGALTAFYTGESRRLAGLFRIETAESQAIFDRVRVLEEARQEAFANDYSIWDELVNFLNNGDKKWADTNLPPTLSIFKIDAIWLYKTDITPFYFTNNHLETYFDKLPVPQGVLEKLFAGDSRFCHFFISTPKGVMEIRGATIHPAVDRSRKNKPAGYFLTGRFLNSAFEQEMSHLTMTTVTVDASMTVIPERSDPAKGLITFVRELPGWNGIPVAILRISSVSRPIKLVHIVSMKIFVLLTFFFIVVLVALIFNLIYWVSTPLAVIVAALSEMDPMHLNRVIKRKDEFGRMAVLIRDFFEQKKMLLYEISARNKAETELKISEERFMKAFRSNPSLMTISKLETGYIIDANEAFLRVTGFSRDEVIGHTAVDLKVMDPEVRTNIRRLLYGKRYLRDIEIDIHTKEGHTRTVLFSAELVHVGQDEIMIVVANDITARKHAEEELQKKMEELERFNKLAVGRELKMLELKARIEQLEKQLEACKGGGGKNAKA